MTTTHTPLTTPEAVRAALERGEAVQRQMSSGLWSLVPKDISVDWIDLRLSAGHQFRTTANPAHMDATPTAAVPAAGDWVLVPRVPTQAMIDAADMRDDDEPASDWGKIRPASREAIWSAMLAATPAPPSPAETREAVAWVSSPFNWEKRQSESVRKFTRHEQAQYGFTIPLYTTPPATTDLLARLGELADEMASAHSVTMGEYARRIRALIAGAQK